MRFLTSSPARHSRAVIASRRTSPGNFALLRTETAVVSPSVPSTATPRTCGTTALNCEYIVAEYTRRSRVRPSVGSRPMDLY
jgi:hypothetical protein